MAKKFDFKIGKTMGNGAIGRAGVIRTPHGEIQTPAFIAVGTKATVKALAPEQVASLGAQAVLANTYHLYLEPGPEIVKVAGGFAKFMRWRGPTFTDSGGFQVFSLGAAFGKGVSKVARNENDEDDADGRSAKNVHAAPAKIDEDGVTFTSHIDGSTHRFTPERSIQVQRDLGADIIFAFDECTSPHDPYPKQQEALERTNRWAKRSLTEHERGGSGQALFGVVQGGKYRELRESSAKTIGDMDFDGFGIGGSFTKDDIGTAVRWVNAILPADRPRHLLGIGEPLDIFLGVENGVDTFDCVSPTRLGRNGALYTARGRINVWNARYVSVFEPIDKKCDCYTCENFTLAYLSHLFRAQEMLAATLASIHNLRFLVRLAEDIRKSILEDAYERFREDTLSSYYGRSYEQLRA